VVGRRPATAPAVGTTATPSEATSSSTGYYNQGGAGAGAGAATNTSSFDWSNTNTNTAAPTPAADNHNTFDSWAAPAPAVNNNINNSNNNWAAPTPNTTINTGGGGDDYDDDWYAGDTSAATATAITTQAPVPAAAANMYTSSGFAQQQQQPIQQQQQQQQGMMMQPQYLQGSMDNSTAPSNTTFVPNVQHWSADPTNNITATSNANFDPDNFDDEPPLLEELGIHWDHIFLKTKAVVLPLKRFGAVSSDESSAGQQEDVNKIFQEADLVGPIAFGLLLGAELVLTGKLQFGYIYGFGMFGCVSMTLVVNLMAIEPVSVWTVTSVLGYALLPVNGLALVKCSRLFYLLPTIVSVVLAILTVAWSTTASTRLLEVGCGLREQRYLIAYPIALLYSAFVMITIF
jgi:hypothetical protein